MFRITVEFHDRQNYIDCEAFEVTDKFLECWDVSNVEWLSSKGEIMQTYKSKYLMNTYIRLDEIKAFYTEDYESTK
jgi:hypothetical protein